MGIMGSKVYKFQRIVIYMKLYIQLIIKKKNVIHFYKYIKIFCDYIIDYAHYTAKTFNDKKMKL